MAQRDVDRLYALPLNEFTSARNALVRELRKKGAKDEAETVRALSKPSMSAWAINQLARRDRDKVAALVKAGDALRKAQRDVLAGKAGADVREASRAQHEIVDDLVSDARELLDESGAKATATVAQRISATLRAASTDPAAAKMLLSGRLTEDVESIGFGPLLHVAPKPKGRRRKRSPDRAKSESRRKKLAEAQARVRQEREALESARREAAATQKAAARAERAAERAAARVEAAERKAATLGKRA
jgi:hypothetical protein